MIAKPEQAIWKSQNRDFREFEEWHADAGAGNQCGNERNLGGNEKNMGGSGWRCRESRWKLK